MDGSQKLPQRMLATIRDNLAAESLGRPRRRSPSPAGCATSYGERRAGQADQGVRSAGAAIRGASRRRIAAIRRRFAQGFLGLRAMFDEDLHNEPRFARAGDAMARRAVCRRRGEDGRAVHIAIKLASSPHDSTRSPSRPAVPGRSVHAASSRARCTRRCKRPADRQPARPHRSAVVRRRRAVRRRVGAVHHARSLRVPDALQPGRAARGRSAFRAATAGRSADDARKIWRTFAAHYHLFRGTPTRIWLDHAFRDVFGIDERLTPESADRYFDRINACLARRRRSVRARCSSDSTSK